MNYKSIVVFLSLIVSYNICALSIRVLLEKYCVDVPLSIIFSASESSLKVGNPSLYDTQYDIITGPLELVCRAGVWYVNGQKIVLDAILLTPTNENDSIVFNNHYYSGSISIIIIDSAIFVINTIDLEQYVENVLHCETCPLWPLENNKLSAIVIRTFGLYQCLRKHKYSKLYDIKSTREHQMYRGIKKKHDAVKTAVQDTKGMIISYENKPIIAMYHICCGGIIPAYCSGFDFEKFPYLKRMYVCNFCNKSPYYEWDIRIAHKDVCQKLSQLLKKTVTDFTIKGIKRSKTGGIRSVTLMVHIYASGKKMKSHKPLLQSVTLNHAECKKIFGISMQNHSACFSLEHHAKNVIIKGKGRGHHMGMCQYGALKMVMEGKLYPEIINFYFPSTTIQMYEL